MTAVADIRKGQVDLSCKGEHQTLIKQSMRNQVCTSETSHKTISVSSDHAHVQGQK